ncbi:MAG: hypothetical protein WCJ55_11550 [Chloroflexales bacterium]
MTQPTYRLPLTIFLLLCGIFLLTMSGHTYSADEETMVAVTRGLLTTGDVAVTVADDAPVAALRPGLGGRSYSPYGVLPSLLALPLYGLGLAIGGGGAAGEYAARFLISALNAPLTAATAALLAWWALRLGARRAWATCLALLYALCTFAWPYARTFFSEPLASLLIIIATERAWSGVRGQGSGVRGQAGALFVSGLAVGLLLPTRIAAGVALPVIGLYILWGIMRRGMRSASCILHLSSFILGLLPGLAILAWYNLARFGTPLASGYASESGLFTTPLATGLYGLLISPGKSVLLFAPPLLLALPGGVRLWRRGHADLAMLCAGLFLSHLLLYAMWGEWQGGGVWGPRFLLPVVAVAMLPAAALGLSREGAHPVRISLYLRALAGSLALIGFVGNLGGVLLSANTYLNSPGGADKVYHVAGSPLLAHWRILLDRWGRYLTAPPACALGDGWYPSESPSGAVLPRRSGAVGELRCRAGAESRVGFTLDDRRPPAAPPSGLHIVLNGRDLGPIPSGQLRAYHLMLPDSAHLEIRAAPWNPQAVGFSPRDDALGPQIDALRGVTSDGQALTLADTSVAPLPARPKPRWAWYYDPPNQHLADLWLWYLPRSELTGRRAWLLGGLLILIGAGALVAGTWLSCRAPRR